MKIILVTTILSLFLSLLSACSFKPDVVTQSKDASVSEWQELYVVSHGWHTGFVVPGDRIQLHIPELKKRFGNTPNIEFGWGDKDFYQAEEITTGLTLRSIFWPTDSVIHAVAVPENVNQYFSNSEVKTLCLSKGDYFSLLNFIASSFYKNQKGEVLETQGGIYGNSQFYKGVGDFSLLNTCNKWTAKGLKSAGMDISPAFKLTAGSIMTYLGKTGAENHCF